jgi:cytochrome c
MRTLACSLAVALALGGAVLPHPAAAQGGEIVVANVLEMRAKALLEIAARHIQEHGEAGAQDFARQSAFVDRDLYAYAVRTDGRFLASGGASAALVGDNVLDYRDDEGKTFFREMIDIAKRDGEGAIEYRWFNPADSRGEPKLTFFRKVGEVIVAVGYYPPRATNTQARALLDEAVTALDRDRQGSLRRFQDLNDAFIRNDLYVFVVEVDSGRFLAHGATPSLVGTQGFEVKDPRGRLIVREMVDIGLREGKGELDYLWRNPMTLKFESKHTFFRIVDGLLVGVGSYNR